MQKSLLITLASFSVLLSCMEASNSTVTGPSGKELHTTKCNQSAQSCMEAAAKTCKGPYQVIDSYSKAGGLVADVIPGPVTWYYMSYQCGPTDGNLPTFPFRGPDHVQPQVFVPQPQQTQVRRVGTTNCTRMGDYINCTSY